MPIAAQLTITLDTSGQVQVTGNLENALLVYGLLECARDVVKEFNSKAAARLVQPAFGPIKPGS